MHQAPRKYGCLRAIGYVILIAAWIVLILGIGGAVTSWLSGTQMFSGIQLTIIQVVSAFSLLFALVLFFQWFVLGSVLMLMTDLERNTRRNAMAVDHLVALAEAQEKAVAVVPLASVPAELPPELPVPPPVTPPPPPSTPTLETKPVAVAAAASTIEGPLPPPPPMAPSLVNEAPATVSAAAGEAAAAAEATKVETVDAAETAVTAATEESKSVASDTMAEITDTPPAP